MYICSGHFLAGHIAVLKDKNPLQSLRAIDTDLMVAQRVVGYDPKTGEELTDLVKVDEVIFIDNNLPKELKDLIPNGFKIVKVDSAQNQNEKEPVQED